MAPELRGGISYLQELVSSSAYEEIVRTERVITEAFSRERAETNRLGDVQMRCM